MKNKHNAKIVSVTSTGNTRTRNEKVGDGNLVDNILNLLKQRRKKGDAEITIFVEEEK